jgi:hypothetical protein
MYPEIQMIIFYILTIVALVYLFGAYDDSKEDPSQIPFGFEEKKNFFISPEKNPIQSLKYTKECKKFEISVMHPDTKKLSDVFKFRIQAIHIYIFIIIILLFFIFFVILFNILILSFAHCFPSLVQILNILNNSNFNSIIFGLIALIIIPILFIRLIYITNFGDIMTYRKLLLCKNVNYGGFEKYRSIENLGKKFDFILFLFLLPKKF